MHQLCCCRQRAQQNPKLRGKIDDDYRSYWDELVTDDELVLLLAKVLSNPRFA